MICDYYDNDREETDWPVDDEKPSKNNKLTKHQINVVRTCWKRLQNVEDLGVKIFGNLFEINPESIELFPFKKLKDFR